MNQQEINEEGAILDKACRQCGGELATHGGNHLRVHAAAIGALVRKLDRLEAAAKSLIVPLDAQPSEPIEKSDAG